MRRLSRYEEPEIGKTYIYQEPSLGYDHYTIKNGDAVIFQGWPSHKMSYYVFHVKTGRDCQVFTGFLWEDLDSSPGLSNTKHITGREPMIGGSRKWATTP